jgi:hypothetical protein
VNEPAKNTRWQILSRRQTLPCVKRRFFRLAFRLFVLDGIAFKKPHEAIAGTDRRFKARCGKTLSTRLKVLH